MQVSAKADPGLYVNLHSRSGRVQRVRCYLSPGRVEVIESGAQFFIQTGQPVRGMSEAHAPIREWVDVDSIKAE